MHRGRSCAACFQSGLSMFNPGSADDEGDGLSMLLVDGPLKAAMRLTVTVQEWNSMCGMSKKEVSGRGAEVGWGRRERAAPKCEHHVVWVIKE